MAKLTWLGSDDEGLKSMTWGGQTFKKDEAVDIDNPNMIAKAKNNKNFKVEGADDDEGKPAEVQRNPGETPNQAGTGHSVANDPNIDRNKDKMTKPQGIRGV